MNYRENVGQAKPRTFLFFMVALSVVIQQVKKTGIYLFNNGLNIKNIYENIPVAYWRINL